MEIILLVFIAIALMWIFRPKKNKTQNFDPLPEEDKKYLLKKVEYYRELNDDERKLFDQRIQAFLFKVKVSGVNVDVDHHDELLVAASGIIPVFAFPHWEYPSLTEVLLYPDLFNEQYKTGQSDSLISGMVGNGPMTGKVIFSKPALHLGYSNANDKKNVGIHEFVHLIDMADGVIDGVPEVIADKLDTEEWLELMQEKMDDIHAGNSDVNAYGGTDKKEFLPVIVEYFFERPRLLKKKHPKVYDYLNKVFIEGLAEKYKGQGNFKEPGRNDKCLCGSGKKYKHCCGR